MKSGAGIQPLARKIPRSGNQPPATVYTMAVEASCIGTNTSQLLVSFVAVMYFASPEAFNLIEALSLLGPIAMVWPWTGVAATSIEAVIDVAVEVIGAMEPWTGANEDAA